MKEGLSYEGTFENGNFRGLGRFISKDHIYTGEISNDGKSPCEQSLCGVGTIVFKISGDSWTGVTNGT